MKKKKKEIIDWIKWQITLKRMMLSCFVTRLHEIFRQNGNDDKQLKHKVHETYEISFSIEMLEAILELLEKGK